MKRMEAKIGIDFHWARADDADIPEAHIEALKESAWERIVQMSDEGYTSGELSDFIRVSEDDPEEGVHYRGWWDLNLISAEPVVTPRVLVVVNGGIADPVCDEGVDVEVFDWDNYRDDPEGAGPVPSHFRDLAEPIDVPVEEAEEEGGRDNPRPSVTDDSPKEADV